MNTLAIMQPYFFPYIGYWQLMRAVDRFVIYDDVNYIKGGWINRNRVIVNGEVAYLTAPLQGASPFRRICDTRLLPSLNWRENLVKTIEMSYRKAPHFDEVFPVIAKIVRHQAENLSDYLVNQLQVLARYSDISTAFVPSSRCYGNDSLAGQARVIDICRRERSTTYINAQGGRTLYDAKAFREAGIDLRFIAPRPLSYPQQSRAFVPNLSIIDVLMAVGRDGIRDHLDAFQLMEGA